MAKKIYTSISIMIHCTNSVDGNNYDLDCLSEFVQGTDGYDDYVRVSINDVVFFMSPAQYETLKRKIVELKK